MKTSESIIKIAPALLEAQKLIGSAKKGSVNPFFHSSYASLGDVMSVCKEPCNENGIILLQPIIGMTVETVLLHTSGEWLSSETPIVSKEENNPQALGSAISYARRYGLQSMLFIPAEDDDGNKATEKVTVEASSKTTEKVFYATPKQVQLISILLEKKGQSDEDLKKKYKVESKKDLTLQQASTIIDNLNKLEDVSLEGKSGEASLIDEADEAIGKDNN